MLVSKADKISLRILEFILIFNKLLPDHLNSTSHALHAAFRSKPPLSHYIFETGYA